MVVHCWPAIRCRASLFLGHHLAGWWRRTVVRRHVEEHDEAQPARAKPGRRRVATCDVMNEQSVTTT